ncbi:MAG: hypothetical protein HPY66_2364 [Firmicutes bacterium]|nr:hypothetical protein [Bacillota bacterium]MDI6705750.1 CrcB family protein [Bacillota bacterium]
MQALYIGFGGAAGAVTRYLISLLLKHYGSSTATLLANLTGCFLIGLLLTLSLDILTLSSELRTGIAVGFIGALTTFSTFTIEVFQLLLSGEILKAALYPAVSGAAGLLSAYAGIAVAARIEKKRTITNGQGE